MRTGSVRRAVACFGLASVCASLAVGQLPGGDDAAVPTMKLELPKRIPHPAPPPAEIPALPENAAGLPDLTLEFREIVAGDGTARRRESDRILTRSRNRVHLRFSGGRQEWLFLQNPVDPRRLSGLLINHAENVIVTYYESDLRMQGVARGWLDVLTLGLDARIIGELSPAAETTEFAGARFGKLVAKKPREDGLVEVWWSEELLLPMRVVRQTGQTTQTYELTRLTRGADPVVLEDPLRRFPGYTTVDFADWHEEH